MGFAGRPLAPAVATAWNDGPGGRRSWRGCDFIDQYFMRRPADS
jgi:hypothetical protein